MAVSGVLIIRGILRSSILGLLVKPILSGLALKHARRRKRTRNEIKKDVQCGIQATGRRGASERFGDNGTVKQAL